MNMEIIGNFQYGLPSIRIRLEKTEQQAVIDTGFNGELALPHKTIQSLGLQSIGYSDYLSADGETIKTESFAGTVLWFGETIEVTVTAIKAEVTLIGISLLFEHELTVKGSENKVIIRQ